MAKPGKKWWRRRRFYLTLLVILFLGGAYYYLFPDLALNSTKALTQYSSLPDFKATDRITIVAPHLDDETLGLGGLMSIANREKIPISVIFMTNGDDNPIGANLQFRTGYATPDQLIASGKSRQEEAINAMGVFNVSETNLYFLGLPDRGLAKLRLARYQDVPYLSTGTLESSSPYPKSYIPNLAYTGTATKAALLKALNVTKPTLIFTTAPEDKHADHSATAAFVNDILPEVKNNPKLLYFLIHYPGFPRPRGINVNSSLLPPSKLANQDWQVVFLDPEAIADKQKAINDYHSQLAIPQLGRLMRSLVRKNELILH